MDSDEVRAENTRLKAEVEHLNTALELFAFCEGNMPFEVHRFLAKLKDRTPVREYTRDELKALADWATKGEKS